jgi:hypothetical protein
MFSPTILAERALRVSTETCSFTLAANGFPLAPLDRFEQFFLVSVNLHGRILTEVCFVAFRLCMIVSRSRVFGLDERH